MKAVVFHKIGVFLQLKPRQGMTRIQIKIIRLELAASSNRPHCISEVGSWMMPMPHNFPGT